ncbi:hypothetical protein QLQ12_34485 [Actinoplanes sp. NEAU-A12]|uniref:Uncharacterized protein n=1 Tax=Actinoplanes sandaracinus TaxID=3045177 RepID=A0ABT6WVG9_9ACTN|nr:hypothetical protein [Actinoplanes sandaracinus]MDI6103735.1 hypothetical protein [Actinoplanes sandaracinus]
MTSEALPEAAKARPRARRVEPSDSALNHAARADRALRTVAVALGVLIAAYVSFLMPSIELPLKSAHAGVEGQSVLRRYGPALAMLTLLPVLVAAMPAALPAKVRGPATAAAATGFTAFAFLSGNLGLYYFPVALLLWAATIVPSLLRRGIGRVAARSWRLAAAAFIALPALPAAAGLFTGDSGIVWAAVALWVVGPIVLAALCASGLRAGYAVTALAGALVMIAALLDHGFLFAAFWLFAAVFLTIGASGLTAAWAQTRDGAE